MAQCARLKFSRIQFTPDLMPSDSPRTDIFRTIRRPADGGWCSRPGPIFTNILLADEINRTPPRPSRAAGGDAGAPGDGAGQDVSSSRNRSSSSDPEPDRARGNLPAPRSALDRFMFEIRLGLPHRGAGDPGRPVHDVDDESPLPAREHRRRCSSPSRSSCAACRLSDAVGPLRREPCTHQPARPPELPDFIKTGWSYGASVRAPQHLLLGGKSAR